MMFPEYDVIVVGAGHSGGEAAAAAANIGSKVLLITMNMDNIAQMSCNPAMGGIGKGQILREIDALGGYSAIVSDKSIIQYRMLNRSKGPAMWSPRSQNDRMLFSKSWREMLEQTANIDFWQDMVTEIIVSRGTVCGVKTRMGMEMYGKSVILTNGTFLNGIIHVGLKQFGGGRMGEKGATGLTEQLVELGFEASRLKTGTPPRVDLRSLDYSKFEIQGGDDEIEGFSFLNVDKPEADKQKVCWISYTNEEVHEVLKNGFDESPMFTGRIKSVGPRYCPSVEDKINRFKDKTRHQIFVEPEGWNTVEGYVNGFSTSLPEEVQFKAIRLIPGFEKAKLFRPGYAIEYDYFPPTQLKFTLETKLVENLYFAGQINGTTGYEEAGAQGLIAGINAHRKVHGDKEFILRRNDAYIGVLIDDIINKGVDEPYRMFTSRAEFRTLLRQDNADLRLTKIGYELGLAKKDRYDSLLEKERNIEKLNQILNDLIVPMKDLNEFLVENGEKELKERKKLSNLLLRPGITINKMAQAIPSLGEKIEGLDSSVIQQVEIQNKYESYIKKENEMVIKMSQMENLIIPDNFNYDKVHALNTEARIRLMEVQPKTMGQASRIRGVNPSDIQILMIYMGR